MKYIVAIIQPDRLDDVLQKLEEKDIHLVTVSSVMGRGRQKGISEVYRSHKEGGSLLKKTKLELAVNDDFVKNAVDAITSGFAPRSSAVTAMVGKSTLGSSFTGRARKANRPNMMTAATSTVVATGRSMKIRERFIVVLRQPPLEPSAFLEPPFLPLPFPLPRPLPSAARPAPSDPARRTVAPSCSAWGISMSTRSPAWIPLAMTTSAPICRETFTGRTCPPASLIYRDLDGNGRDGAIQCSGTGGATRVRRPPL